MKTLYAALIGIVVLLMVAHSAVAGPPSWDTQINIPNRFKVLKDFNIEAVLDQETGLVWEKSPETAPNPTTPQTWFSAQVSCNARTVGGRKGWRLPTIQELASLVDPTVSPGPTLPPGHPFSNVQPLSYWSATTAALFTSNAWNAHFGDGGVFNVINKTSTLRVWCVRGGQGVDPQ
jgi:hypothetical protein